METINSSSIVKGSFVTVSSEYESISDASSGPLSPGVYGVVIEDDSSDKPFQVKALVSESTWWYVPRALKLVTKAEAEAASKKASAPAVSGQSVTRENFKLNLKVKRGRDWKWGDQDNGGTGILVKDDEDGWCKVKWDSSSSQNAYRIGKDGCYDLVYVGDGPGSTSSSSSSSFQVGSYVTVSDGYKGVDDAAGGPLSEGLFGIIVQDDQDHKPYKVRELKSGNCYWYKPAALKLVTKEVVESESSNFSEGDQVRVKADVKEPKRGWGKVKHSHVGTVKDVDGEEMIVDFPSQSGWHGLCSEMELAPTVSIPEGAFVSVTPNFRDFGDAANGPLSPGSFGILLKDDQSDIPYHVKSIPDGRTFWYRQAAIKEVDRSEVTFSVNREEAKVHKGGSKGTGGDTKMHQSDLWYCGRQMKQCRCGSCDGQCGPTNGCPCNACVELLGFVVEDKKLKRMVATGFRTNREGAAVHKGASDHTCNSPAVECEKLWYCGRRMNQCRCGRCDGQCGPSNGCPCTACVELAGYYVQDGVAKAVPSDREWSSAYCDACGERNWKGRRYKCLDCPGSGFDVCGPCFDLGLGSLVGDSGNHLSLHRLVRYVKTS